MSHLQARMNEAEMSYFHSNLSDPARGTNPEHLGNVFVFDKLKCTCAENNFCPSLVSKITEKGELTKMLSHWRNFSHSLQTLR